MQRGLQLNRRELQRLFECCLVNDTEHGTGEGKEHLHNSQLCVWSLVLTGSELELSLITDPWCQHLNFFFKFVSF